MQRRRPAVRAAAATTTTMTSPGGGGDGGGEPPPSPSAHDDDKHFMELPTNVCQNPNIPRFPDPSGNGIAGEPTLPTLPKL